MTIVAICYRVVSHHSLSGNFGVAMEYQLPVAEVIADGLGLTIAVSVAALLFAWAAALPTGTCSAVKAWLQREHEGIRPGRERSATSLDRAGIARAYRRAVRKPT
jgi:ABC-type antimicrobial peptide transport system permease subunit